MFKYVSVKIPNKDCKGIYLFCDSTESITSAKQAEKLINDVSYKMQLRTKVNNINGKKVFTFSTKSKTFIKALEFVASERISIRSKLHRDGTVREIKKVANLDKNYNMSFLDKVESFIETKSISARPSTMQNYSTTLMKHSKPLHDRSFISISIEDVQKIVNKLLKSRANATVVLYARTLKVFLKELSLDWSKLELPEVDNEVLYTLTFKDTKKIISAMREYSKITIRDEVFYQYEEIKNIFAFSLTGRRINEILALKFSDLNLENGTFRIAKANSKGKKEQVYNLDNYLLKAIKSQAKIRKMDLSKKTDTKVFSYTKETPRVHFQNLLKALGLPKLRLHDIRHMIATTLVQNGVPIQDISTMLGHSSIAITEKRYASTTKEQASNATDSFNSLMSKDI